MKQQHLLNLKLLNIKLLLICLVISLSSLGQVNRAFEVYGGVMANKTFCSTIRESDQYNNSSKGGIKFSYELGAKLKYSKHFSVEFGYQKLIQQISTSFNDIKVIYISPYTHGGTSDYGMISYTDNIYLNGNHFHIGMNYEFSKGSNNFNIGLSHSITSYGSGHNYVTRDYTKLETLIYTPNIHYQSSTTGKTIYGINAHLKYERMFYKNKLAVYGKLMYQFNFNKNDLFEYDHSGLGYDGRGYYDFFDANGNRFSNNNYYYIYFNSSMFSIGVSYKFNFKNHEKNGN